MSPTRRDFIRTTAATAATVAVYGPLALESMAQSAPAPAADPAALEIANEALSAAKKAGASYADARVGRYRRQSIATRERQVAGVNDSESYGLGVRTLVDGSWGFAATSTMTRAGARHAGDRRLDDARTPRSDRRAPRRENRAAPRCQRGGVEGAHGVASRARACAAIAASQSSIRVPRRSRVALMRPNIRLTASVHSARGSSAEMKSKRACSAARRFERGSRSMPNAISARTGCGTAMSAGAVTASRSTTAAQPFMRAERALVSRT